MSSSTRSTTRPVVKYIGTADVRLISKQDWKDVGIAHETVSWSRSNGWTIGLDKITNPEAMAIIELDDELVIKK